MQMKLFNKEKYQNALLVHLKGAQQADYVLLKVAQKGDQMEILSTTEGTEALESIKGSKAFVVVNGQGLINRIYEKETKNNTEWLLTALPGVKKEEFVLQTYSSQENMGISIVRLSVLEDLLTQLNELEIAIEGLCIGPVSYTHLTLPTICSV